MKIGDIVNFAMLKKKGQGSVRDHVCKVEVMKCEEIHPPRIPMPTWGAQEGFIDKSIILFTCRRVDNGTSILAWREDLT